MELSPGTRRGSSGDRRRIFAYYERGIHPGQQAHTPRESFAPGDLYEDRQPGARPNGCSRMCNSNVSRPRTGAEALELSETFATMSRAR